MKYTGCRPWSERVQHHQLTILITQCLQVQGTTGNTSDAELKATKYALQEIAKTRPNTTQRNTAQPEQRHGSQATWTNPCVENKAESMRIDHLLDGLCPTDSSTSSPRGIGVTSDDLGLCTLNTYAATTLSKVTESIRHYNVATSNRVSLLPGSYQTTVTE
jgi:hypothetical protein